MHVCDEDSVWAPTAAASWLGALMQPTAVPASSLPSVPRLVCLPPQLAAPPSSRHCCCFHLFGAQVENIRGFCPGSQLGQRVQSFEELMGRTMNFKAG